MNCLLLVCVCVVSNESIQGPNGDVREHLRIHSFLAGRATQHRVHLKQIARGPK